MFYSSHLAVAHLHGNHLAPHLHGTVTFTTTRNGVLVEANVSGLPASTPENPTGFFAFHLHEGENCNAPSFSDAKGHYNPSNVSHPNHAGDFPMLLSTPAHTALLAFITRRFSVKDIIGRTIIVHAGFDDYSSQTSGNAGFRIACGVICAHP
jgi:Cu-Zn family superoxide dismutase